MMAKTLSKEKAAALAASYMCNGFNKSQALRDVGCTDAYSKSPSGYRLFDNELVKTEIEIIVKRNADAVDVSVVEIIRGMRSIAFPSPGTKVNNSDRNVALANLAKYKNMLTDRLIVGTDDEQRQLAEIEQIECQVLADIRLRYGDEIKAEIERRMAGNVSEPLQLPTTEEIVNG